MRVDAGIDEHSVVPMAYDPMVAKLCTWGGDRDQAIDDGRALLDEEEDREPLDEEEREPLVAEEREPLERLSLEDGRDEEPRSRSERAWASRSRAWGASSAGPAAAMDGIATCRAKTR